MDYPKLPSLWEAETNDGFELYQSSSQPSNVYPNVFLNNNSKCQKFTYTDDLKTTIFLVGCEGIDCCYESDGDEVKYIQFPNRNVDVYHQVNNITNFEKVMETDEWSWQIKNNKFKANTRTCNDCVNKIELLRWTDNSITKQYKNFKGYDLNTLGIKNFLSKIELPTECQKKDIKECPVGIYDKDLQYNCGTCGTAYQACCAGFALDGYPCDCHLSEDGSGKSGANCGDCGTGYAACCIGYDTQGYPCQCDVL